MTIHEKARDLIERYLYKVCEELPRKQRDDVKTELRSLIEDAIEERAGESARPFDEELAAEVLREFGKPEAVAERYLPTGRYLIGPRLFPVYLNVAKIVLIVLAAIYAWSVGMAMVMIPSRMPELFRQDSVFGFFSSFAQLAFVNLALLTVVFALIERFGDTRPSSKKEEWDPKKLPAIPEHADRDRVSQADRVFRIYAIVALFLWLNQFPDTVGIWYFVGDQTRVLHFRELGLHLPLLWMNIWWGLALALNMWVLKQGRWTRESRWAEFGLGLYGAAILYLVLVTASVGGAEGALVEAGGWGPLTMIEAARAELPRFGRVVHIILSWVLLFTVGEALVRLYRIVRRYPLW